MSSPKDPENNYIELTDEQHYLPSTLKPPRRDLPLAVRRSGCVEPLTPVINR
jgi:hypothetical protein